MQKNAMAEKRLFRLDNVPLQGLVKVGALPLTKGTIEVPGFHIIRVIENGVSKIPEVELTFRLDRNSPVRQTLIDWYNNDETHDVVIVETDASGQEFGRILAPLGNLTKLDAGEYAAENPTYAHLDIILLPWDLVYVKPQT